MISLEIDGKKVTVDEGSNLLDAARKLGIEIPTLCSHRALLAYGACRLCLVEVQMGNQPSSIQASCTYPALHDLVVKTDTEKVIRRRRVIMELLLARCPDSQQIKSMAKEMGVESSRVAPKGKDCMLCGLCVRMCNERMGRGVLNFIGRGNKKEVSSPFGKPSCLCFLCGACEFVCPTDKIIISQTAGKESASLEDEFNIGLRSRPAVYLAYPQAVPNIPVIDEKSCVRLLTGKCGICQKVCGADAVNYEQKESRLTINVGAILLTSGVELFDANLKKEYGFSSYKNVLTSIQLERLLSSSGPTEGKLLRLSDNKVPKRLAFIQCVGSRDESCENEFCSSVCCMYATKEALIAKEHEPDVKVKIFYIDIRAFGKGFERYYETAKANQDIEYQKCMISKVYEQPDTKNLQVRFIDEEGRMQEEEFEMVVLSVGLTDRVHIKKLAKVLGLELNEYGFYRTDRLSPSMTNREAIFVAGTAVEPKDIPETVIDGSSAASLASAYLSKSRGELIKEKEYPPEIDVSEQDFRIGVFVCRCGRNIASIVNVPEVVKFASHLPGVVYAREFLYSCSQDSLLQLKKDILDNGINRVVVASCTPRTHELLFRDTVREAGLNKYLFDMASIREHVSWVHMQQKEEATKKAKELVKIMVAKVRASYPIEQAAYDVSKGCLVVGAGAAGMWTSLNLARNGYEVFLVEKEDRLGGNLLKLSRTADGQDIKAFLEKLIKEVEGSNNIRLFKRSKVKKVSGFLGNFKTTIENLESNQIEEVAHGAVIIAVGAEEYKPKEFAFGASPRIVTQSELEARSAELADLSNSTPQTIVMIQCVGSRNKEHPYCSRLCCSHAVKNALELKRLSTQHKVVILYRDMRTYGFLEKLYLEAREKGVLFNRFDQDKPPEVKLIEDGKIKVSYYDTILQEKISIETDWLILSTGVVADEGAKELSELFKIPTDADGFFMEAHAKVRPLDCSTDGIFLCGLCHSPQHIHESLAQAQAAAVRAITILSKKKIESRGIIVKVNERVCKGCGICVSVCPYGAREIDNETAVAVVHEILCQGCGACAVACPSGATEHKGFSKNQIMAMVEESV